MILLTVFALLAAACGDDDGSPLVPATDTQATTTTAAPATTAAPTTTVAETTTTKATVPPSTEPESNAISSIADAEAAVVQIVSEGTFVDPFEGTQTNAAGAGSGFIISESGLAVTANHVVTGGALIKVYFSDEDQPRNARLLGVSECSDLAVIDLEGDGYPFFDWYDGPINAGLEIFAAGYPLGDPQYTLLDGIVSKDDAGGETYWASIDAVVEHSADTLPGNSGGPLLTADGQVAGIVYAGNQIGQEFAISAEIAAPVVAQLVEDIDVDGIGINGEALFDSFLTGIWVYSVASGSPADDARVQPGDLIVSMEGLDLALDGTMADYCDILRSHGPDDTLSMVIYRSETDQILEGQINGRELEVVDDFSIDSDGTELTIDPPTFGTYVLNTGFTPDPSAYEVISGGSVNVNYLGGGCVGWAAAAPDIRINWTGSTFLRFYFIADEGDTALVVNDPNVDWACNDDSFGTLNPTVDFTTSTTGAYDIWVASFTEGEFVSGTLYVTELDFNSP
jgi:S1-C subfamily serine protease